MCYLQNRVNSTHVVCNCDTDTRYAYPRYEICMFKFINC